MYITILGAWRWWRRWRWWRMQAMQVVEVMEVMEVVEVVELLEVMEVMEDDSWQVADQSSPGSWHYTDCCLQYLPCQQLCPLWLGQCWGDWLPRTSLTTCSAQSLQWSNECRYERERERHEKEQSESWIKMWEPVRASESNNAALSAARLPGETELWGGAGPALPSHHQARPWRHTIRNNNLSPSIILMYT